MKTMKILALVVVLAQVWCTTGTHAQSPGLEEIDAVHTEWQKINLVRHWFLSFSPRPPFFSLSYPLFLSNTLIGQPSPTSLFIGAFSNPFLHRSHVRVLCLFPTPFSPSMFRSGSQEIDNVQVLSCVHFGLMRHQRHLRTHTRTHQASSQSSLIDCGDLAKTAAETSAT